MPALIWGGRFLTGWLVTVALQSVADTAASSSDVAESLAKAAPWIVGGGLLFVVWRANHG